MEKMTNKKALMFVKENFEMPADVAEKIDTMIASLEKKSTNHKPTKTQAENEVLKAEILNVLTKEGLTASEVLKASDEFNGLSNQKISALLNQMVKADVIEKTTDGKKTLFKVLA